MWGRGGGHVRCGPAPRPAEESGPDRPEPVAPRAHSTRTRPRPRRPPPLPGLAFAVHGGSESTSTRRRGRLFFSSSSCSESLPCHVTPVHSASVDARVHCRRKPRPLAGPPVAARRALTAPPSSGAPPSLRALLSPRAAPSRAAPPSLRGFALTSRFRLNSCPALPAWLRPPPPSSRSPGSPLFLRGLASPRARYPLRGPALLAHTALPRGPAQTALPSLTACPALLA